MQEPGFKSPNYQSKPAFLGIPDYWPLQKGPESRQTSLRFSEKEVIRIHVSPSPLSINTQVFLETPTSVPETPSQKKAGRQLADVPSWLLAWRFCFGLDPHSAPGCTTSPRRSRGSSGSSRRAWHATTHQNTATAELPLGDFPSKSTWPPFHPHSTLQLGYCRVCPPSLTASIGEYVPWKKE